MEASQCSKGRIVSAAAACATVPSMGDPPKTGRSGRFPSRDRLVATSRGLEGLRVTIQRWPISTVNGSGVSMALVIVVSVIVGEVWDQSSSQAPDHTSCPTTKAAREKTEFLPYCNIKFIDPLTTLIYKTFPRINDSHQDTNSIDSAVPKRDFLSIT